MADGSITINTEIDEKGLKKGLNKISDIAKTSLKTIAAATGAVATGFAAMVTESVKARGELEQQMGGVEAVFKDYATEVKKLAEESYSKMGTSASDYMATINKMGSLMQGSGIDIKTSMDLSSKAMQRAADVASIMGIDINSAMESIAGAAKGNFTMMDNLGVAMNATTLETYALEKGINKTYASMSNAEKIQLAMEMFLEKSTYAAGNYAKENDTLAGSISTVKASWNNFLSGAGNLGDVLSAAKDVVSSLGRVLNEAIKDIFANIDEWLSGFIEFGSELVSSIIQGINDNIDKVMKASVGIVKTLISGFVSNLPLIIQMGMQMISELIKGIGEMLPELIPQTVNCVTTIVEGLLDNLDLLIDAGIELILGLADGLIEALPLLLEKVPIIIEKVFDALVRNFPKIVKAGGELIGKLAMGIIGSVYKLLEVAPKVVENLANGLSKGWQTIQNVGKYLIEGLWKGISDMASWVFNKIKGFASSILDGIKGIFGIHSPSKVFRDEVGKFLALGIGEGFSKNIDDVYKKMKTSVDFETQKLNSNLTASTIMNVERTDNISARLESIDNDREITVNAVTNLDGRVLTQSVNKVNARQRLQYGLA